MCSSDVATHTLDVPGAHLYYEVRGSGPLLLLVGAPMGSAFFAPLADALAGAYTVVTSDPRGIASSTLDDPDQDSTPQQRADDLHRIIDALDAGPADVFGTSGGAVSGIDLVARHPEQVRTLIAHEPRLLELLPDRVRQRAAVDDIYETYCSEGQEAAWTKFFAASGLDDPDSGPGAGGDAEPDRQPEPAGPPPDQGPDGAYMLGHMLRGITRYEPDIAALRSASTRIVVGVGVDSVGQTTDRTSAAFAALLGSPPVELPGDHVGFIGRPAEFAQAVLALLAAR